MNLVRQLLPCAVQKFVGGCVPRGLDRVMFDDQRVQLDHFIVVMEHGDRDLARYLRRERRNVREKRSFRHGDGYQLLGGIVSGIVDYPHGGSFRLFSAFKTERQTANSFALAI